MTLWRQNSIYDEDCLTYIPDVATPSKPTGPKTPRPSRGKSGKPAPPPNETEAGTPGFGEAAGYFAPVDFSPKTKDGLPSLPALRGGAPRPPMGGESLTDSLTALLTKPQERSERAKELLSRQPLMATHPIVSGGMPTFVPHRPERPEKSEGGVRFRISSEFEPKGDQPQAITELVEGVGKHEHNQVLLGVTGSGKTFTMAHVIERTQRPALIIAPNKTLAAQLYGEFKSFFPENAVEYFVSD